MTSPGQKDLQVRTKVVFGLLEEKEGKVGLRLLRRAREGISGVRHQWELEVKTRPHSGKGLYVIWADVEGHSRS